MSNNLTIFSGQSTMPTVPEDLADVLGSSSLFSLARNNRGSNKRLSIRGNKFRMQINGEEVAVQDGSIDVVVLGASESFLRQYYAKAYDPKDTSPPDCWSNDNKAPHENSGSPQASACAKCPQNIAGSGVGTSKACQTKANIAVVLANNIEGGDIFEMTIPAQSLFNKYDQNAQRGGLLGYSSYLDGRKIDPRRVVTRITFDADSATPLLWFSGVDWVAGDQLRTVVQKSESDEAQDALIFHYPKPSDDTAASPARAAAPTPSRARNTRAAPTPAAAPAPVTPAQGFGAAPAAPAPAAEPAPQEQPNTAMNKAAALLDEWGEDV